MLILREVLRTAWHGASGPRVAAITAVGFLFQVWLPREHVLLLLGPNVKQER